MVIIARRVKLSTNSKRSLALPARLVLLWLVLQQLAAARLWAPQDDLDTCFARIEETRVAAIIESSGVNVPAMTLLLQHYLATNIMPKVLGGCHYVSLTSPLGRIDHMSNITDQAAEALPARDAGAKVALLFSSDGAPRVRYHLQMYPAYLTTHWFYAVSNSYDLLLFTHPSKFPPKVPGHFSKVFAARGALYALGYDHLLAADWDSMISPMTAVPFPLLTLDWPGAAIYLQAEENMCSAVIIYRRCPATQALLDEWWALGRTGMFAESLYDQAALKHILGPEIRSSTGEESAYPDNTVATAIEPPPIPLALLYKHKATLIGRSHFGFVNLHESHRPWQVSLHTCRGQWGGCIPRDAPALVHHTGHRSGPLDEDSDMSHKLSETLSMWLNSRL